MRLKINITKYLFLLVGLLMAVSVVMPAIVLAGDLSSAYIRLGRMRTGTSSTVRVVFTTSADATTENNLTVNFNGTDSVSWTGSGGSVNATQTISSVSCVSETGASALTGTPAASGSGAVVTVSGLSNLAASTSYCFDLTSTTAVTLPSAGEYHPVISTRQDSTVRDTAVVAVRVVSDDQVTVTATVPPTFTFQLDSNSTAFTDVLSPGLKRQTNARTITVNTNAKTGWVAWLKNNDANGLYSSTTSSNIAPTTPGTAVDVELAASTEQYVWGVSSLSQGSGVGVTTIPAAYDARGSNEGSGVDQTYRQIAASNGTAADAVVTFLASATISGITPAAGDYVDVIEVIGAGQF